MNTYTCKHLTVLISSLFFFLQAQIVPTYILDIPLRDGKVLAADVYVPVACNSCPVILIQTPYNKNLFRNGLPLGIYQNLQSSPYAWVVVDWRGFYGSSAASVAQPDRGKDAYDVLNWIIAQSWSNGKVGTWGPSALGVIQYLTAKEKHPAHVCAVPLVAHPHTSYDNYFYGGVLEKARLEQLDLLGYGLSPLVLGNPYYSNLWQFAENNTWYPQDITIPTLQIGGWYDHNIDKMIQWYVATRRQAEASVRNQQWLLVGPWVHGGTGTAYVGSAQQGQLSYPDAEAKSDSMAKDFFQYYLLQNPNNWEQTPLMTYYDLGKQGWKQTQADSVFGNGTGVLYLDSNGLLSGQNGNGSSTFVSDPGNPSPTLGGQTLHNSLDQGPYNQNSLELRSDVLNFTTGKLFQDIEITGRTYVRLHLVCDQPDADISVRLADVYPDGKSMLIQDGIRRLRFKNGYTQAAEYIMSAPETLSIDIQLPFIQYTWKAGHELKIYISGNNAYRWDVNLQNGGTMYAAGDTNIASIEILHSSDYPSQVLLPGNSTGLSVLNTDEGSAIKIFPNPAYETLEWESPLHPDHFSIWDTQGKCRMQSPLNSKIINIKELPKGIYFIQFEVQGKSYTNRFVKLGNK